MTLARPAVDSRLQLSFARRSLFLPNMKVFRMSNHLLDNRRKMKKGRLRDVLVV